MKKRLFVLLGLLFLTGCEKKAPLTAENIPSSFCCYAETVIDGTPFGGSFEKTADKEMSFTLDKPASLNGCRYVYTNGDIMLQADGLSFSLNKSGVPQGAVPLLLFDFFAAEGGTLTKNEDGFTLCRTVNGIAACAAFDASFRLLNLTGNGTNIIFT